MKQHPEKYVENLRLLRIFLGDNSNLNWEFQKKLSIELTLVLQQKYSELFPNSDDALLTISGSGFINANAELRIKENLRYNRASLHLFRQIDVAQSHTSSAEDVIQILAYYLLRMDDDCSASAVGSAISGN